MMNRNDAIGSDEWRNLPLEKQMVWKIPIEVMLDLPHLRKKHNVITLSEYFLLQDLDPRREISNGRWDREYYHHGIDHPTLFVIPNHVYDPDDIARVDNWIPADYAKPNVTSITQVKAVTCDTKLITKAAEKKKAVISWDDAKGALRQAGISTQDDALVTEALEGAGWVILHTFDGE